MDFIHRHASVIKWTVYSLLAFFTFVFQTTFGVDMRIMGRIPNMLLGLVLCIAMFEGARSGFIMGAAAGLLIDICASEYVGFNLLFIGLICCALGYFASEFLNRSFISSMAAIAAGAFLYNAVYFFFHSFISRGAQVGSGWLIVLIESVITMIAFIPGYFLLRFINKKLAVNKKEADAL